MTLPLYNKSIPWAECFYDHFEKYLGKPTNRFAFMQDESENPWLQIIEYSNVFDNCKAFCTFGLSRYASQVGVVAEVFMPLDEGWEYTPTILAATLSHLIRRKMVMARGQVINFADIFPDFVAQFDKSAVYFSDPFGVSRGFEKVGCNAETGEVYLACFISQAEYVFKVKNGTEQFEALLEEKGVDVFALRRKHAV